MRDFKRSRLWIVAVLVLPMLAEAQGGLGSLLERRGNLLGKPGGQVEAYSRDQYFDQATSTTVLDGDVEVKQEGAFSLKAQRVVYYDKTGWLQAEGQVQLQMGRDLLTGDTATYNVQTGRAKIQNVHAVLQPSLILEAESVERLSPHPKTGEDRFFIVHGVFTSCHRPGTGWNLKARKALIHMNHFVHLYGVVFRVKSTPLFYLPYVAQSIKRERSTGFLPPRLGYDDIFGAFLNLEFFWAIADWADLSVTATTYGPNRLDGGATLRFLLSPKDVINTISVTVAQIFEEARQRTYGKSIRTFVANLDHAFPYKIQSRASATIQNSVITDDPNIDPRLRTRRYNQANAVVSRTWGSQSLRLLGNYTQGFRTPGATNSQSLLLKLPSLAYSSGAPWNILGNSLQFVIPTATLENIRRRDVPLGATTQLDESLWRLHFVPRLQGTLTLPGVSIQPSLSLIETYYSQRKMLDPNLPNSFATFATTPELRESGWGGSISHVGDGLYRHLYNARVEMVGPSFYKLYDTDEASGGKLKHLIQPTVVYQYSPFVDESEVFDTGEPGIDRLGVNSHSVTYELSNILLYKNKKTPSPNEVLRFDVRQTYFLIEEAELQRLNPGVLGLRQLGDLNFKLVVSPLAATKAEVTVALEPEEWRPRSISGDLRTGTERWGIHARYFRSATFRRNAQDANDPLFEAIQHSATLDSSFRVSQRWNVQARGIYNILDKTLNDSYLQIGYGAQCWGFTFGGGLIERRPLGPMTPVERNYSVGFSIHLKNLGGLGASQRLN